MAQGKRLPAMRETQVQSLAQEDPLEKEMATPSHILAWEIPWTEEPGRLQSMRLQRVEQDLVTKQQLKKNFQILARPSADRRIKRYVQIFLPVEKSADRK